VQTFGINETKRSETLRRSCRENCNANIWRRFVFNAKLSEFELTFPDPMGEFNAGKRFNPSIAEYFIGTFAETRSA
jgi:hypothetical protein